MKSAFLCATLGLVAFSCHSNDREFERILKLEDRRVNCDSLVFYLSHSEPQIRARSVQAIGKLQDPSCMSHLINSLADPNHNVRIEAVFALGQLGDVEAENALIRRIEAKDRIAIKVRVLEALGKIGTDRSFRILRDYMTSEDAGLRAQAVLSVGRMALRNLTIPELTATLPSLLEDSNSEVRWKAAYAVMQIGDSDQGASLIQALGDSEPLVRKYAIQALGKMKNLHAVEEIGAHLKQDKDWRVRVAAANALGNHPLSLVVNYYSLLGQTVQVKISILKAMGTSAQQEPTAYRRNSRELNLAKHQLETIIKSISADTSAAPLAGAALMSYAQLMGKESIDDILPLLHNPETRIAVSAVRALGATKLPIISTILGKIYDEAPANVQVAILGSIAEVDDFSNPQIFLKALQQEDHPFVALAAKGLSRDSLRNKIYAGRITDAYQKLERPVDSESAKIIFEAMAVFADPGAVPVLEAALSIPDRALSRAAAAALLKITGTDYSDRVTDFTKPNYDFSYNNIIKLQGAKTFIKTNRGDIEIELFTEAAPLTVLNFAQLADRGFFDKLTFHRVVPNFVVQGGDPRGDSWGSPGYAIRSEFNKKPFLRGTVGMASAGKDTEGCQFFITHSPQPHLEGRYTVFGQVTSGMRVVDSIREGDSIELVAVRR